MELHSLARVVYGETMEPLVYILAIMGCNDAGTACVAARTEPATYVSETSCRAAQEQALLAATDVDYPTVMADCRASSLRLASNEAADARAPKR